MLDTIEISRTTATPADDAIDLTTGKPIPGAGETPTVVYLGKAFLSPDQSRTAKPDGAPVEVGVYQLFTPWDSPLLVPGDVGKLTAAQDPAMVNLTLTVTAIEVSSLNLARVARVEVITPTRPIHGD